MHGTPPDGIPLEGGSRLVEPNPNAGSWYAVWTRSRHEQIVRQEIERKRIEAFLPTITRWSRWKDRKKKIA